MYVCMYMYIVMRTDFYYCIISDNYSGIVGGPGAGALRDTGT